ncbi:leucine-rich repeat-containing protein 28-like [Copidosoma floridanum]|uniref:leucine-rich repeat-containing protein 28-like n=1 Tax=Copidosoma floridanum TaxID=29053 RepID=UPI0006C99A1A|nr:leucine-rich repeat-containing protein 28-like [Copidosoma floridanum]
MIDTDHYVNRSDMSTSLDLTADMVNEAREKLVLHWNYRGLSEIPEAVRHVGAQVQEIYLKWNELKSLPIWLADFASVTNLYLYGNKIERLPDTLGLMTKLTVLDLSANRLEELPDCLGSLEALRSLLLNQNYIASLPTSMSKLRNLEYLCLSGNQLVVLPEWLGSLPNLAELFADNNNLREIPNRLTLSTSLDTLSVCSNKLSHLPLNGFASSPQIRFDSNSRLNYLSLPVFCQLVSKLRQSPSQGNTIAYGCFGSTSNTTLRSANVNIQLSLVPESNPSEHSKSIVIELPRQLLVVHGFCDNGVVSLWELSLRKVYSTRFRHTLDICLDPMDPSSVLVQRQVIERWKTAEYYTKLLTHCDFISNGPTSVCMRNSCDEPIFTEAWIAFGIGRNALFVPTIVIFCSHRCAVEFVKSSSFTENYDMYVIQS